MNFSKINELKPYDLNCNIFDVYSYNGLSMQELLCQFFTKINECIKTSNETIDLAEWLVNEGLKQEVALKLTTWLNDGTLENIINVTLFENLNEKIDNVSSQLEHTTNKFEDVYERQYNILNYDSDLNRAIIKHKNYKDVIGYIPKGIYYVDEIVLDKNQKIYLHEEAVLKPKFKNQNILKINENCVFNGGLIDVRGVDYQSACITNDLSVKKAKIKTSLFSDYKGKAVEFTGNNDEYMVFCSFDLDIEAFSQAIVIDALTSSGKNNFKNGNIFNLIMWGCGDGIINKGGDGNTFNFQFQSGYTTHIKPHSPGYGVYCKECNTNTFNGFVHDVAYGEDLTSYYCYFEDDTYDNSIIFPMNIQGVNMESRCINKGRNIIGSDNTFQSAKFNICKNNNWSTHYSNGDQDNILAYAHHNKLFNITKNITNGFFVNNSDYNLGENNLFISHYGEGYTGIYPVDTCKPTIFNIKILFNEDIYLKTIGLNINAMTSNKFDILTIVKFKNGSEKIYNYENLKYNNFINTFYFDVATVTTNTPVEYIDIQITTTGNIGVNSLFATAFKQLGNTFITKNGGDVYGDISLMEGKGIILKTPDNSKAYKISIDNTGNVISTLIQ